MTAELLACPLCRGPLVSGTAGLACPREGLDFPHHPSGLPDLRPPAARRAGDEFAAGYRLARLAEGWQPLAPAAGRALPEGDPPGFTRLYWTVRRESWLALAALLPHLAAPPLTIADLGAGIPWLSHRLAGCGHRVVAVDLSPDADFGLAAARHYPTAFGATAPDSGPTMPARLPPGRFLPVLGDLTQPPLAHGRFDALICNASLHYADDLPAAIRRMVSALRPAGVLIVMDSPVAARPRPGAAMRRVLGRDELDAALRAAGLAVTWRPVPRGWLWRRRQAKSWLLRRPSFEFPLVVAACGGGA